MLTIGRHDLELLAPLAGWRCDLGGALNVAAQCEAAAWARYRCVSDLLFTVPRRLLGAFNASVGSHAGASRNSAGQCGCFDGGACPGRPQMRRTSHLVTGHDCHNVLAARLAAEGGGGGGERIGFCWPPVVRGVHEASTHLAPEPRAAHV